MINDVWFTLYCTFMLSLCTLFHRLLFFLRASRRARHERAFSPLGSCGISAVGPSPGLCAMVASVPLPVAPSSMPLTISVFTPLRYLPLPDARLTVLPSRVQSLCSLSQSFTMSFSPIKRTFRVWPGHACRNGKHILAVECVNRDVGRQARFQFQVRVGSGYDNLVGDDRTGCAAAAGTCRAVLSQADLRHYALQSVSWIRLR